MLPSKKCNSLFRNLVQVSHPPRAVLSFRKSTINEEKGSPSICEAPVHQHLQQGTSELLRVSSVVKEGRTPGNTILSQPCRRRVSTDRLNREDSQLAASIEGEPGPTPTGNTLTYLNP